LVTDLKNWFNGMAADKRCEFVVECEATALNLVVDAALLIRVLGNLIKNAIEASKPGSTVTLTIGSEQDRTVFALHNPGVIAPSVAKQLFKSRFTTKGPGRGIGMYTVQVLGEHLLGGRVAFESTEASGTVFRFTLPNAPSLAKA
jgi:signal transduction histidine kinase